MFRRAAAIALLAGSALALSGCVMLPPVPAPDPGLPDATGPVGVTGTCDDGVLRVDQPGEYRIGDCDEVHISGRGIEVVAGDVGLITIRGDDNEVEAASVGSVDIEGQDNDVDAETVGAIEIAGDRNGVDSRRDVGAVTIRGNENEVEYGGNVGAVDDQGARNEVRTEG